MTYEKLIEQYKNLKDNDGNSAYSLMKEADSFKYTLGEELHNLIKERDLLEVKANAVKSAISVDNAPRDNASGARYAMKDEGYKKLQEEYIDLKHRCSILENRCWYLGNISYRAYAVWANVNKIMGGK